MKKHVRFPYHPPKSLNSDTTTSNNPPPVPPLELQIAELVALGQTNAAIGNALWMTGNSVKQALKRIFRQLVSSRASWSRSFPSLSSAGGDNLGRGDRSSCNQLHFPLGIGGKRCGFDRH
jgi:DNA-binding CsgD family transcriptional regulator